jgi:hypothetical protein
MYALRHAASHSPDGDFGGVVRCTIVALSGSLGATALAITLVPTLIASILRRASDGKAIVSESDAQRYASAASLPLAASGWIAAVPSLTASLTALALSCALAYRSGSLGARVFLHVKGAKTTLLALVTCLVATLPSLLSAPFYPLR